MDRRVRQVVGALASALVLAACGPRFDQGALEASNGTLTPVRATVPAQSSARPTATGTDGLVPTPDGGPGESPAAGTDADAGAGARSGAGGAAASGAAVVGP